MDGLETTAAKFLLEFEEPLVRRCGHRLFFVVFGGAYYGRQRVRFGNRFQAILLAFFFYFFLDGRLGLLHRVQLS